MIVETSVLLGIADHIVACELARALSAPQAAPPQQSQRSLRKRRRHK